MHKYYFKIIYVIIVVISLAVFATLQSTFKCSDQQNWYKRLDPDEKIAHLASKAKYKSSPDYQKHKREKTEC